MTEDRPLVHDVNDVNRVDSSCLLIITTHAFNELTVQCKLSNLMIIILYTLKSFSTCLKQQHY